MLFRSRVGLMDRGRLNEVDTPRAMIGRLGRYAVDHVSEEEMESRFFGTQEEAIRYLKGLKRDASLRNTTLEDVFLERAGKKGTGEA